MLLDSELTGKGMELQVEDDLDEREQDVEVDFDEGVETVAEPAEKQQLLTAELNAESLFSADVKNTSVLTRAQEESLAHGIVRARKRVHAILRRARRLTRAALADFGRGVVLPEDDFREREAITILNHAKRVLRESRTGGDTGMNRKDLRSFVSDLSKALADYRVLRDQMVQANVRLVMLLARRHRHPTLSFLDLVQEGTIGLIRAVEKYEPNRNVKFSTYAVYWIWQQMARTADTLGELIRTPVHWNQLRRRMSRGISPEAAEAQARGNKGEKIDPTRLETMTRSFRFVSTDAPVGEDDERPLESVLADVAAEPQEQMMQTDLRERLGQLVGRLPVREAEILRRRFGLGADDTETLEEIGERFGVSRERIRQLEERALRQLRELCSEQGLEEYLH